MAFDAARVRRLYCGACSRGRLRAPRPRPCESMVAAVASARRASDEHGTNEQQPADGTAARRVFFWHDGRARETGRWNAGLTWACSAPPAWWASSSCCSSPTTRGSGSRGWARASDRPASATATRRRGGCPRRRRARLRTCCVEAAQPGNAPELVFSAMDASVAGEIEQAFAKAGHVVVSNSRNHRMDADVPLLIPEINGDHIGARRAAARVCAAGPARSSRTRTARRCSSRWRSRRCARSA